MKSTLRLYLASAALLAATAAHAEPASAGTYSAQESRASQDSVKETRPGDSGDQGGAGFGEPGGSSSEEQGADARTVKMSTPPPSDSFLQQVWTAP